MVASLDRKLLLTDGRIEACFKLFDKVKKKFLAFFQDRSGSITIPEFKEMLGGDNVSDNKWHKALVDADANKDGRIDLYEFKSVFKTMMEESRQRL